MDEVTAVCLRMLGDRSAAEGCAARAGEGSELADRLLVALECCRTHTANHPEGAPREEPENDAADLRTAVARELRVAAGHLPEDQLEAMALRDVAGLSHAGVASVLGVDQSAALALLIRARLGLRQALRGEGLLLTECPEHDRALRTINLRIDSEPVPEADDDWLVEHLGHCEGCRQAHATVLEAAACYRGWPPAATAAAALAPTTGTSG